MSRHDYCDDVDQRDLAMWRGRIASAIRGKRGQKLLADLRDALDALPQKRLVHGQLQTPDGDYCAIGCVGAKRGHDFSTFDPEDCNEALAGKLDVAECLVREIEYENDDFNGSDESRWEYMRRWAERHIHKPKEAK